MVILDRISEYLNQGDDEKVAELTQSALDKGMSPEEVLENGLIAAMNIMGKKFKNHEVFLPDVLLAARAMHAGMDILKPLLISQGLPSRGKVVLGTVEGDLHDIGKNLVGIMLQGAGYDVVDLGNDVPARQFLERALAEDATVVGISALLTTTMPMMKEVVALIKEEAPGGKLKTLVGGAPVTGEFAREIGADAYGYDAANAVECVKELVKEK